MIHSFKKTISLLQALVLVSTMAFYGLTLAPDALAADDLAALSDEFDGNSLGGWSWLHETEGGANYVNEFNVQNGEFFIEPKTSSWYQWRQAPFVYKNVTGDFLIHTKVKASNRAENGAPSSLYSLAGPMIRVPNLANGPENWTFLTVGTGNTPGVFNNETKLTINGDSTPILSPSGDEYELMLIRAGDNVVHLKREPGGSWEVHRRYDTPNLTDAVQVGLIAYTDWPATEAAGESYGSLPDVPGNPDLHAYFDFARFHRLDSSVTSLASLSDAQMIALAENEGQLTPDQPEEPVDVVPPPVDSNPDNNPPAGGGGEIDQPEIEVCPYAFLDIIGHWAESYIKTLCAKGIVKGKTPSTFAPNANVTRAEITKIALEAFDIPLSNIFTNPFTDVSSNAWYAHYVQTAKDLDIVNGYPNGTFMPNANVTRGEALAILTRAAKIDMGNSATALMGCNDVKVGLWSLKFFSWAYDNDVIDGGNCRPNDAIKRGEASKVTVLIMEEAN